MNKIKTQSENPKGLHQRYHIMKVVPVPQEFMGLPSDDKLELVPVDENAEYFVMRLDTGGSDIEHIKACRIGIHAYADSVSHHLPELAKDLKERYPLIKEENKWFYVINKGDEINSILSASLQRLSVEQLEVLRDSLIERTKTNK